MLKYVTDLQHKAITLAYAHGVPRKDLAELAELSGPRITQITDSTEVAGLVGTALEDAALALQDIPLQPEVIPYLRQPDDGTPAFVAKRRRQTALIYGEEEAERRYPLTTDDSNS